MNLEEYKKNKIWFIFVNLFFGKVYISDVMIFFLLLLLFFIVNDNIEIVFCLME